MKAASAIPENHLHLMERTMYRFWILALLALAIAAPSANAASRKKKPPTTETVTGTLVSSANGNPNGCANIPFAAICASGDCVCRVYDGQASGALGQGAATIYVDIDINDPTSSGQGCYPTYASVQFANRTIGVTASACGDSAKDSFPGGPLHANGNFVTAANATAAGDVTGTIDISGNTVALTLTPASK